MAGTIPGAQAGRPGRMPGYHPAAAQPPLSSDQLSSARRHPPAGPPGGRRFGGLHLPARLHRKLPACRRTCPAHDAGRIQTGPVQTPDARHDGHPLGREVGARCGASVGDEPILRYAMTARPASTSKPRAWFLAARPRTLTAAMAPVIVGSALAYRESTFHLPAGMAALLAAVLIQIGANLANDVYDFKKGADADRLGPTRVTAAGLLSPREVEIGMWIVFAIAAGLGVYLIVLGGWPILVIGLLSIAAAIAYTGGPFPLGYNGLGDLFTFVFFGLIAVMGTYYVHA